MDNMPPQSHTFIYLISDTKNAKIAYVGKSNHPRRRLTQHHSSACNGPLRKWLRDIRSCGYEPRFKILEKVPLDGFGDRENYWMDHYRGLGYVLLNRVAGGGNSFGREFTPEQKQRQSEYAKRRWADPKHAENVRATVRSPLNRRKLAKIMREIWSDIETRERRVSTMRSAAVKSKLRNSITQLWKDPIYRAKIVATMQGRRHTKQWKSDMSSRMRTAWKNPPEAWKRFSDLMLGNQYAAKPRSPKEAARLRTLTLGRKADDAELKRRSGAAFLRHKRHPFSEQTRAKMAESARNWCKNNPDAAAAKAAKMRSARK